MTRRPVKEDTAILSLIIRCSCGERVVAQGILQQRFLPSLFGPNHMYLRYRCARCQRLGERYIPEDQWRPVAFSAEDDALGKALLDRFRQMGEITIDEQIDFHFGLQQLSAEPDKDDHHLGHRSH